MGAARLARQQNNFTLASKLLIQQFQSNHNWSSTPINLNIGKVEEKFVSSKANSFFLESYSLSSLVSILDRYQSSPLVNIELETETAKLMHALSTNRANNIGPTLPIDFLSRSIIRHLISESPYNMSRSLMNIEKCSRNLLHIAKWLRLAVEKNSETTSNQVQSLGKLFQLRQQYLHSGLGVDIAGGLFKFSVQC